MVIMLHTSVPPPPAKTVKPINWSKAVDNGDIHSFAEQVSSLTAPFVHTTHQCISELQLEITKGIIETTNRCLPHKKDKRKKPIVKDKQLKDLHAESAKPLGRDGKTLAVHPTAH